MSRSEEDDAGAMYGLLHWLPLSQKRKVDLENYDMFIL